MKKITVIILAGILMLAGQQLVRASDDHSEGYRSKFYGTVEEMPTGYTGTWIVNGRQVEVTPQTKIEQEYGRAAVGSYVEIKGRSDGQLFTAYELEVKQGRDDSDSRSHYEHSGNEEFYGTITTMPQGLLGTWVIDGREVYVNERTRIDEEDGPAQAGARVEVKGSYQKDTFVARKIEVKR
jgi:hypothetical protein